MQSRQAVRWHDLPAKYFVFAALALYSFIGLLSHDMSIHNAIASGNADLEYANELYFEIPYEETLQWMRAVAGLGFALIGVAISILVARYRFNRKYDMA